MSGLIDPVGAGYSVTFNDNTNLSYETRAVYVGTSGTLRVQMINGNIVAFSGLLAGTLLPIQVRRIYSTGTTVASVLALY